MTIDDMRARYMMDSSKEEKERFLLEKLKDSCCTAQPHQGEKEQLEKCMEEIQCLQSK